MQRDEVNVVMRFAGFRQDMAAMPQMQRKELRRATSLQILRRNDPLPISQGPSLREFACEGSCAQDE